MCVCTCVCVRMQQSLNSLLLLQVWFDRRTNYTRSLAVMSMVGYILGLGDRSVRLFALMIIILYHTITMTAAVLVSLSLFSGIHPT